MNSLVTLSVLLLAGVASSAPFDGHTVLNLTDTFFSDKSVVYSNPSPISKIIVPVNGEEGVENVFFFIDEQGLSVFKDGKVTKLLANGKDVASSVYDGETVSGIAATDGLYTYNPKKNTAVKYGTLSDDLKNLALTKGTNAAYILTEDNVVYKIVDESTKKEKIDNVKDAQEIVVDNANNLYFIDSKKDVYVRSFADGSVKKIEGLPAGSPTTSFIRAPAVLQDCVPVLTGNKVYRACANGKSDFTGLVFSAEVTAYAPEAGDFVYIAHQNNVYRYSFDDIIKLEKQ